VPAKIKIEAHKNERRKLKLTSLVRAVHAARALRSKMHHQSVMIKVFSQILPTAIGPHT